MAQSIGMGPSMVRCVRELPMPRTAEYLASCEGYLVGHFAGELPALIRYPGVTRYPQDMGLRVWEWADLAKAPVVIQTTKMQVWIDTTPEACISGRRFVEACQQKDGACKLFVKKWDGTVLEAQLTGRGFTLGLIRASRSGKHAALWMEEMDEDARGRHVQEKRQLLRFGIIDTTSAKVKWVWAAKRGSSGRAITVTKVAVSEEASTLAAVGCDGTGGWIVAIDVAKRRKLWKAGPDTSVGLNDVRFSPDGTMVYAVGGAGHVYGFDVRSGKMLSDWLTGDGKRVRYGERLFRVRVSPDGTLLAAGDGPRGNVYLWDTRSGKRVTVLRTKGFTIHGLAFSPDSRLLATTGVKSKTIEVWDVSTLAKPSPRDKGTSAK